MKIAERFKNRLLMPEWLVQLKSMAGLNTDLRLKLFPLLHLLAKLILIFAAFLLLPAFVSYLYKDGLISLYLNYAAGLSIIAAILWVYTQKYQRELKPKDGIIFVVLLWVCFAFLASFPLYQSIPGISFTNAFFESMAGLTTSGATILTNLDNLAPSLNFWRHLLNWLGGMGIIILAVAILPMLGIGGAQLSKAEMPGLASNNSKLAPRLSKVAKNLWTIYCLFTILCAFSLRLAGMNWFDAVCHAMSTLALGGFSTHDQSIGYFNSIVIEWVMVIFMLLSTINFTTHFTALHEKQPSVYWHNQEVKYSFSILFCSIIVGTIYLWLFPRTQAYSLFESFRVILFNFVAMGSTSGFMSVNYYNQWPEVLLIWMLFMTAFIPSSGSTGGGIKMSRAIVLFKFSLREMTLLLHPNAVRTVKLNRHPVSERLAFSTLAFIFVYLVTMIGFSFILMLSGMDYVSAFSTALACITNTGSIGVIDSIDSFAKFSDFQKWISMLAMLMGRMEIFSILILFTPAFWRK